MIKILALGDVVSSCGTQYLADGRRLAGFREKIGADLVVVNGENSADGNGILPSSADALFHAGADVITRSGILYCGRARVPRALHKSCGSRFHGAGRLRVRLRRQDPAR